MRTWARRSNAAAPDHHIGGDARPSERLVAQTAGSAFCAAVIRNHDQEIGVAIGPDFATSPRPEQEHPFWAVGCDQALDELRELRIPDDGGSNFGCRLCHLVSPGTYRSTRVGQRIFVPTSPP